MPGIGLRLDPELKATPQQVAELAVLAEERGFESLWIPEGSGRDALTQVSALAMATNTIHLGTGILPLFHRTPFLTAMSAAALDIISSHRFMLGLGVGHRGLVEAFHGVPFQQPFARMRDTVEIVRQLLRGETITYNGRIFSARNASLGLEQGCQIPIYIAALGPQMIELAGEIADGLLLTWVNAAFMEEVHYRLARGAARAGRNVDAIDVVCYVRVAVTDDTKAVGAIVQSQLLSYVGMPFYRRHFEQAGFKKECAKIIRGLRQGDRAAALDAVSEEMQRLAVFGSAEFCRQQIEKFDSFGVRLPVVAPLTVDGDIRAFRATMEAFSE